MLSRIALAGIFAAGFVLPAAAQSAYYIVQDPSTRHCEIVDQRPIEHHMTVVGPDGTTYHTRIQAENAMRTVKVCHP